MLVSLLFPHLVELGESFQPEVNLLFYVFLAEESGELLDLVNLPLVTGNQVLNVFFFHLLFV